MKLYVVVKTARKDAEEFPSHFQNPHKPAICLVDSYSGHNCTPDRGTAEKTAKVQTEIFGKYFNYTVHELEITD